MARLSQRTWRRWLADARAGVVRAVPTKQRPRPAASHRGTPEALPPVPQWFRAWERN